MWYNKVYEVKENSTVKLYKEHILLIGLAVSAVIYLAYFIATKGYDQSPTVDGFTPIPVEIIQTP